MKISELPFATIFMGTLCCGLFGIFAFGRSACLAFFTLAAVALLARLPVKKWYHFPAGGALAGLLAGLSIILVEYFLLPSAKADWISLWMPVLSGSVIYGTLLVTVQMLCRHCPPGKRWFAIIIAAWLANIAYFLILLDTENLLVSIIAGSFANSFVFVFPWALAAMQIMHTDEQNSGKFLHSYLILYLPFALISAFFMMNLYLEAGDAKIRKIHNNRKILPQLTGYINVGRDSFELPSGQKIFIMPPPEWPERCTPEERVQIAQKIGHPELTEQIRAYAVSPDGKYLAILLKSQHIIMEANYLVLVFENDKPARKGLCLGKVLQPPGILWLPQEDITSGTTL